MRAFFRRRRQGRKSKGKFFAVKFKLIVASPVLFLLFLSVLYQTMERGEVAPGKRRTSVKKILAATIFATVTLAAVASVTISKDRQTTGPDVSFGSPPPPLCPPFCGTSLLKK